MKIFDNDYDALIVGCGLSGAVAARSFAEEKNKRVLVIDRRDHIAGNMYDKKDENGILVQQYGPHIFHTNNRRVYDYMCRFCEMERYDLECMVYMCGKYTPSPFNFQTIDDYYSSEDADALKKRIGQVYKDAEKTTIVEMLESTDPMIKQYAEFLFDNDYSLYTAKQWGISPAEIDVSVLKRVPVLFSYKKGYFDDKYQAMPKVSFTDFFENLLNHENITIRLNTEARDLLSFDESKMLINGEIASIPVIYTGAIDELFGYRYGRLPYRSLRFEYKTIKSDSYQEAPVVAYPQEPGYTRITEYTKLPVQQTKGKTVIAVEYPIQYSSNSNSEPYYPIPTEQNRKSYEQYRKDCMRYDNLYLCGRLADFKYYNMDQALERALELCASIN